MIAGTVKSFVREPTGYGFLIVAGLGSDVRVHVEDCIGAARVYGLVAGEAVEMHAIIQTSHGLRARGVRLAGEADRAPRHDADEAGRGRRFEPGGRMWRPP